MRLVLVVIGVLLVAILGTLFALDNPGHVTIVRPPWRVEMSFIMYVLITVLGAGLVWLIGYLLVRGGVQQAAYGLALEKLTGVKMTKMLPVPNSLAA